MLSLTFIFCCFLVHADEFEMARSKIGAHVPLFLFEKNVNPENKLVVYSVLNEKCEFESQEEAPRLDFYWLMGGVDYKPTHPLIKHSIRERTKSSWTGPNKKSFRLELEELKELRGLRKDAFLLVESLRGANPCEVRVKFFENSKKNKALLVDSIYSQTRKKILPPFRKVEWVSLKGRDPESGEKRSLKYLSY